MSVTSADIRNVAIVGHNGTGKTTLFEHLLYCGGAIDKPAPVDSGKTVSDYSEEEIAKGISMYAAHGSVTWNEKRINFIDTPGTSDFVGEVVSAFRAAESSLITVDARSGVQIETIKLWRRSDRNSMPRFVFINKMDSERASFENTFNDLKEKFNKTFVPVTIPMGESADFRGIINLIENKAYAIQEDGKENEIDIPDEFSDLVEEYRLTLIESAAEGDDDLLEKYFEEGTLTIDEIRKGLLEGLESNKIVPLFCGSAELHSGIRSLLNFISHEAPSPAGKTEDLVENEDMQNIEISDDGKTVLFIYKTTIDQFSGKLSFFKVISGKLASDMELMNTTVDKKEKISKIYKALGKKIIDEKELAAGDLGVLAKANTTATNDTLCESEPYVKIRELDLPQPVYALAISAADKKSEDKMNDALYRVTEQDLTFQVNFNPETKENVISGMGELHINTILDKVQTKQKIEINTKLPKIAYRESMTKPSSAEYTHKKQSGGHGQYGRVVIEVTPLERGEQFSFENAIKGGSISKGYMPGIEKGLLEAMEEGYLAHYPLVDIGVRVVDGKEHPVDSSEMAFKLAGKGALKTALEKAGVVLLEPIMKLHVYIEDQYLGDILSDLSSKRGRVHGQEDLGGGITVVEAEVPQAEMLRYAIDLKSITSGTGSFDLEFDHYAKVTGKIADDIISQSQAEHEQ